MNAPTDIMVMRDHVWSNVQMVSMAMKKVHTFSSLNFGTHDHLHSAHKCLKCDDACETCSGGLKNQCLTCRQQDNAELENGTCVTGMLIASVHVTE